MQSHWKEKKIPTENIIVLTLNSSVLKENACYPRFCVIYWLTSLVLCLMVLKEGFFVNCIKIYHPDVYFVFYARCLLFGVLRIRGFALLYVKRQNFIKLDTLDLFFKAAHKFDIVWQGSSVKSIKTTEFYKMDKMIVYLINIFYHNMMLIKFICDVMIWKYNKYTALNSVNIL